MLLLIPISSAICVIVSLGVRLEKQERTSSALSTARMDSLNVAFLPIRQVHRATGSVAILLDTAISRKGGRTIALLTNVVKHDKLRVL